MIGFDRDNVIVDGKMVGHVFAHNVFLQKNVSESVEAQITQACKEQLGRDVKKFIRPGQVRGSR